MSHKPKVAKLDGLAKLPHLTVLNGDAKFPGMAEYYCVLLFYCSERYDK